MKGSVAVSELRKAVAVVDRAVNKSSVLEVLKCILLKAEGDELVLEASDLEIGMRLPVEAEITEEGGVAVPAKRFKEFVDRITGETVKFSLTEKTMTLTLTCNKARAGIKGFDQKEFVILPQMETGTIIPLETFLELTDSTSYAAATDESRPVLGTINMKMGDGKLVMAAADGFRLAKSEAEIHTLQGESVREVLIPRRAMVELFKAAKKVGGDAKNLVIALKSREEEEAPYQVMFQVSGLTFITQVENLRFPDYEQIIPSSSEIHATLERADLLEAVQLCSVFAQDSANIIRLEFTKPGDEAVEDTLTLSASSAEIGDTEIEVPVTLEGEGGTIALNYKYLLDILSVDTERISFDMNGPASPVKITPLDDAAWVAVQMPMHMAPPVTKEEVSE